MEKWIPPQPKNENSHFEPFTPSTSNISNDDNDENEREDKQGSFHKTIRPNPWRHRIMGTIVLLFVVFISLLVFPIPFGKVEIRGSQLITVDELMEAQILPTPINILQISNKKVDNSLEHDLRVDKITTSYVFPATYLIQVENRNIRAAVMTQFGYGAIDQKGQVIALDDTVEGGKIPIITGVKLGNVLLGEDITNSSILDGLSFLNALSTEGRKLISEINVGNQDMIVAYTVTGLPIRIGNGARLTEKAKITEKMLDDVKSSNVLPQYISVDPDSPFVKTK